MKSLEETITIPGYDLLGSYEAGIPIYKVRLRVRARKKQTISALAEFTLKLINLGIDSEPEISKALGMENSFIENTLEQLSAIQLIKAQVNSTRHIPFMQFALTAKGKEALNKTLMSTFDALLTIQVDGLIGKYSAINKDNLFWDGMDLRKNGTFMLHGSTKSRPTVEYLNADINNLITLFRSQQDDLGNSEQLVEVLEVLNPKLMYKLVKVLVFRNQQEGQIKFRVFEGYEPVPEYDEKLAERERNGSRVIPDDFLIPQSEFTPSNLHKELKIDLSKLQRQQLEFENLKQEKEKLTNQSKKDEKQDPNIVTARTLRIQELENALSNLENKQSSTRLIKASEHFTKLKLALNQSKNYVLIVSPWIKADVVDKDMVQQIKECTQRGVWILIGYGMPLRRGESKESYIDEWVTNQFKAIQKLPNGNRFVYLWLGNTHEKILVCDDVFSVVTSYNWLSYRGDKGFRSETGTYSEDPRIVSETTRHVISEFKLLPEGFPIKNK